jgi:hypothetical protein
MGLIARPRPPERGWHRGVQFQVHACPRVHGRLSVDPPDDPRSGGHALSRLSRGPGPHRAGAGASEYALWSRRVERQRLVFHSDHGGQPRFKGSSQLRLLLTGSRAAREARGGLPVQGLAGSAVEGSGDGGEVVGAVFAQVGAVGAVLRSSPLGAPLFVEWCSGGPRTP